MAERTRKICVGFGKRGLLEKGSFQKSPFSRDSRECRDSRDSREPPDCGKQRRIRPFSRESREFKILEILGYFLFFSARGERGVGGDKRRGGRSIFLLKIPGGRGSSKSGGGGDRDGV